MGSDPECACRGICQKFDGVWEMLASDSAGHSNTPT